MNHGFETRNMGFIALLPLVVFLGVYLFTSIIAGDFYKMPITVAFLISGVVGILISKGLSLQKRIDVFIGGAANVNIIFMVMIFILLEK